jgi:hypothetical protein
MGNQWLLGMLSLADRIEADRSAVWEWFFRTPIWPYGSTAFELAQNGRGDEVIAFLRRILSDMRRDGYAMEDLPAPRDADVEAMRMRA